MKPRPHPRKLFRHACCKDATAGRGRFPTPAPACDTPLRFKVGGDTNMRRDGWTEDRQARFIAQLRGGKLVREAAAAAGATTSGAYKLRRRDAAFARAWDRAIRPGSDTPFQPVPRARPRHDGLTPERQAAFIDALEDLGSVAAAARSVGVSPDTAYKLRRQPGAEAFAAAWEAALARGVRALVDASMERAIRGVPVPVMYRGRKVAERRQFDEKLAMFHMRHRLPEQYGGIHAARDAKGGRFISKEEVERLKQEAIAEHDGKGDAVRLDLRARLDRIHAHWVRTLSESPEHMAAYRLLFGPGAPGDLADGAGAGVHIGRLPPPLSYALIGVAREEEQRRLHGRKERDGEAPEAGAHPPAGDAAPTPRV